MTVALFVVTLAASIVGALLGLAVGLWQYRRGAWVISDPMAADYDPPSTSVNSEQAR